MSPEQADGKSSRIGPATDVYQTALVLFQLLAGRLPYEVEDRGAMALLKAVLFERRMLLSEVVPELGGPLEELIHSALNADPAQRPQTVQLFAAQLQLALAQMD
jgi:serine/threonine protein kinase